MGSLAHSLQKHLRGFNLALLSKQAWRVPLSSSFEREIFRNLKVIPLHGHGVAYVKESIFSSKTLGFQPCLISNLSNFRLLILVISLSVASFTRIDTFGKSHFCTNIFQPNQVKEILEVSLSTKNAIDRLKWHYHNSSRYSVGSGYFAWVHRERIGHHSNLQEATAVLHHCKNLWKMKIPNKIKIFIWKLFSIALPVGSSSASRLGADGSCIWCGAWKSRMHLFFLCPFSQHVWSLSPLRLLPSVFHLSDISLVWEKILLDIQTLSSNDHLPSCPAFILWHIWKARNASVFDNRWTSEQGLLHRALTDLDNFQPGT
ncbi:conserved hypothetical protein [Ricinus communis]|uniref:Reverse transcriptase zinc-binding domain-containing protein n=1 Tax=Ricinus communis TaxID=3988 RepID=B9S743_RICCO|nr:conserved hypothetical protein [Ricinus communis]